MSSGLDAQDSCPNAGNPARSAAEDHTGLTTPAVWRYAVPVWSVGSSWLLSSVLQPYVSPTPLFLLSIMLSTWAGGRGPGLLAALLSTVSLTFVLSPDGVLETHYRNAPNLVAFLLTALLVGWWSDRRQRAERESKRTRDQLATEVREREDLWRQLTERTNDFIRLHEPDGRSVYASPSVERLYGRQPTSLFEFACPEDLEACRRWWDQVLAGVADPLVWCVNDGGGNVRWLESSATLVRYQGRPHVLTVCRDTTDRRRAEEALSKSERILREAEQLGETGSCEYDAATGAIFATAGYRRNCFGGDTDRGRRPEAFFEAIHPDDRGQALAQWNQLLTGSERDDFEYRVVWRDGTVHVLSITATVVRDDAGRAVRVYGTSQDVTQRRRVEDQLRRSEEQAHQVLDTIPLQIWSGPPDGTLDYCNRQWRAYTGLAPEDVRGDSWQQMLHPEDRDRVLKAWDESVVTGTPYEQEERHRRADGVYHWFLCRGVPLRDAAGRVERWYGANTDIEDRKRAEEDLRRSEERFRSVIEAVPVMAWTVRPDGVVDFLNRRWVEYSGLSLEQYVADPAGPIHADDVARVFDQWRLKMATDDAYSDEMRLRRFDGEYRWFLVRTAPVRDELGQVVKWFGVATDIEDRKRAEHTLRESQERLQSVLATLPVGVVMTDPAGNIVLANAVAERIWGGMIVPGRERWDQSRAFWHDSGKKVEPSEWASARALSRGETSLNELIDIESFDGRKKTLQNSAAPIRNAEGRVLGAVVVNEDVTERVRSEQALADSAGRLQHLSRRLLEVQEEERRHIARELHDEFGQILTAASLHLHAAKGAAGETARERLDECATLLQQAGERVRSLALELRPTMLDTLGLEATLRWLAEQHRLRTGGDVQVVGHYSGDAPFPPELEIACFRVTQEALTNVARHASARHVWIELGQSERVLEVVVRDDGTGFDVATTQQQASRRGRLGLLGMAERVQLLGGTLRVESEPGRGTRIRASFPLREVPEE